MIGSHHEAAREPGDFFERGGKRRRNRPLRAMGFMGLSYKLYAEGGHLEIAACAVSRGTGSRHRSLWESKGNSVRGICLSYRTWHKSSKVLVRPGKKGGASLPVQGRPECAFWGT